MRPCEAVVKRTKPVPMTWGDRLRGMELGAHFDVPDERVAKIVRASLYSECPEITIKAIRNKDGKSYTIWRIK